jgi:hypothetical protein
VILLPEVSIILAILLAVNKIAMMRSVTHSPYCQDLVLSNSLIQKTQSRKWRQNFLFDLCRDLVGKKYPSKHSC